VDKSRDVCCLTDRNTRCDRFIPLTHLPDTWVRTIRADSYLDGITRRPGAVPGIVIGPFLLDRHTVITYPPLVTGRDECSNV